MSNFNAKNLTYDKQEPSFLRKLRGEVGGARSNIQIARPKKDRLKTGDQDEDEPTIVDENGETVKKEEWEMMLNGKTAEPNAEQVREGSEKDDISEKQGQDIAQKDKQNVVEIGGARKRKAVKVVGEEEGREQNEEKEKSATTKIPAQLPAEKNPEDNKAMKTSKKKSKKIKLSFDESNEP